jgi:small conductance mechanosensitive channel
MSDIATIGQLALNWIWVHGLVLVGIVVGAWVAQRVAGHLIEKFIRRAIRQGSFSKEAEEKRENTLIQVLDGAAYILIWITALLMALSEVGVAIGPLLAAAGIVGIAVGFGGQYLIRDLISGIFFIIENQYRTGDVVCFDSTCGLVEKITLRMTTLRDLDGTVHHVPHGEVKIVSNLSKHFARVNLDIGVSYSSNLEQVIEVVNATGGALANDPVWKGDILKPVQFERVNDFADSAIVVKVLGETKPLRQWAVAGEFRKRIKIAFDKAGIEIPFPQRVVHQQR